MLPRHTTAACRLLTLSLSPWLMIGCLGSRKSNDSQLDPSVQQMLTAPANTTPPPTTSNGGLNYQYAFNRTTPQPPTDSSSSSSGLQQTGYQLPAPDGRANSKPFQTGTPTRDQLAAEQPPVRPLPDPAGVRPPATGGSLASPGALPVEPKPSLPLENPIPYDSGFDPKSPVPLPPPPPATSKPPVPPVPTGTPAAPTTPVAPPVAPSQPAPVLPVPTLPGSATPPGTTPAAPAPEVTPGPIAPGTLPTIPSATDPKIPLPTPEPPSAPIVK